jgi:hypothetical protein
MAPLPEDTLIVTIDLVALYPSIPQDEVSESLKEMAINPNLASGTPPLTTLLPIVEHVLQNNVFEFDGELFKQIQELPWEHQWLQS